ncbi:hypothetical protein JMK10_19715 [Rhodovulum sulfidophilum]|uniref:hypothetical protein n=1 Tax=Rhodovulum sulfidophilum TaxID=35806 RepID=UPI001922AD45|nr:hypothetical protein [Rhodovulum sulfidophilum]MBL3576383.1 hypothetical protein [Rhodovulum sulfidophilum]MCE8433874.1 hypothetical protein [Rhodovulum sulfidophilum]MCF4118944.1 hypothetical protein [Rhodovulum sulfidophilum]
MSYLPLTDKLRQGDIVLVRGENLASKGIRAATRGQFSHAMICVDPPTMIEAVPGYVRNLSLSRCYIKNIKNIRVLRYPDKSIAVKAATEASLWLDMPYSILAAICSVKSMPRKDSDSGVFCSRLVAEAYRKAGGDFVDGQPTSKITPAMIDAEPNLQDVTASLFEPAPIYYNLDALSALDVDVLPWVADELSQTRRNCAEGVLPAIREYEDALLTKEKLIPSFMRIVDLLVSGKELSRHDAAGERKHLAAIDRAFNISISESGLEEKYHTLISIQDKESTDLIADSLQATPRFDIASIEQGIANSDRIDRRAYAAEIIGEIADNLDFCGLKKYSGLEKSIVACMRRNQEAAKEAVRRRTGR